MIRQIQENKRQNSPFEVGRSMLEMLMVLVVVAVIMLSGVWAVIYALNYIKANAIISGAQTRILAVDRRDIQRDIDKMDQVLKSFGKNAGGDFIYGIYPTELEKRVGKNPVLKVSGISNGVCNLLKRRLEVPMTLNDKSQKEATCLYEDKNIARFDVIKQ